ncbi:MAG TPA: TetR/AcrR family transcriptional regulator [Acidimicrobiales bacterium]|nr:TetR/AcrR family transcriptional regulator [Acidimicrobiales bacterium]
MAADVSSPRSPPDRHGQRRAILDAALAVLAREGEAGFTVRRIAEAAGCSTTGVYTWFGGKAGLVDAIFVEGFESFDAALEPAYAAGDLVAAGREYRRWALANPTHFLVMFGRAVPDVRPGEEALRRGLASFQRLVDHVRLVRPDLAEDEAFDWAYHVNATVHGYVLTELTGMSTAPHRAEELFELGLCRLLAPLSGSP